MSLNIQTAAGLIEIGGKVTKEKVISALGYEPANKTVETAVDTHTKDTDIHIASDERTLWNRNVENLESHKTNTTIHVTSAEKQIWNNKSDVKHYEDLEGAPDITDDNSGNMVIADESGNIIMQVDADGVTTTNVSAKTINLDGEDLGVRLDELEATSLPNILDNESGDYVVADENGNIIMKIDADGIETTTITAESAIIDGVDVVAKLDELTDGQESVSSQIASAIVNKSDVGHTHGYSELENAPNIAEDESGAYVIADESGNVILKVDAEGTETTQIVAKTAIINGVNVEEKFLQVEDRINNIQIPSIDGLATEVYVDEQVAALVNSAPDKLNTLDELAAALGDDANFATTVTNSLAEKANKTDLNSHTSNTTVHITADERAAWNAKSDFSGDYNELTNAPSITENNSGEVVYADEVGNIIARIDDGGFETTTVTAKSAIINGIDVLESLDGKASTIHYHEQYLTEIPSEYVTETELNNKGYLTSIPSEYITESELTAKGYLTQHQNISHLATTSDLNAHAENTQHITADERTAWNNKSDFSGDYNDLTNAPSISEDMTDGVIYADKDGNIIARVDDDGLKTTAISAGEIRLGTQSLVVETWTFTLEDGTTVTKRVVIG